MGPCVRVRSRQALSTKRNVPSQRRRGTALEPTGSKAFFKPHAFSVSLVCDQHRGNSVDPKFPNAMVSLPPSEG